MNEPVDAQLGWLTAQALYEYADAIDNFDLDHIENLALDGVVLSHSEGTCIGKGEFRAYFAQLETYPCKEWRHVLTNIRAFNAGPNQIRALSYFEAHFFFNDRTLVVLGDYDDTYEMRDRRLLIDHKRIRRRFEQVLPTAAHLQPTSGGE